MNEVIEYEQTAVMPSVYSDVNLYERFFRMAESLSKTDIVPSSYRGKPENCLIAIDTARQVGCKSPLFIMQNLNIIKGKPSWSGQYCSALVYNYFQNVQINRVGDKENGVTGIYITALNKNNIECRGAKITLEMAKKEGWIDKEGSKWKTMPEQMLIYRAFTFFARAFCPERLLGMSDEYEIQDISRGEDINSTSKNLEARLEQVLDVEVIESEERIKND